MVVAYEIVEMIVRPAKPFPLLSSYSSYPMCWSIVLLDVSHALHHDSPFDQPSLASRCHSSLPSNDRLSLHHLFRNSLTGVSGVTKMFNFLSSNASSTHVLRELHFLLAWFQFSVLQSSPVRSSGFALGFRPEPTWVMRVQVSWEKRLLLVLLLDCIHQSWLSWMSFTGLSYGLKTSLAIF